MTTPGHQNPTPSTTPIAPGAASAPAAPADGLVDGAQKALTQAREHLAKAATNNRGAIVRTVDSLGKQVDDRTGGKYHARVESAKGWLAKGLDQVIRVTQPARPAPAAAPTTPATSQAPAPASPPSAPTPVPMSGAATAPASPAAPSPAPVKEGWHRGPDGQWVRS